MLATCSCCLILFFLTPCCYWSFLLFFNILLFFCFLASHCSLLSLPGISLIIFATPWHLTTPFCSSSIPCYCSFKLLLFITKQWHINMQHMKTCALLTDCYLSMSFCCLFLVLFLFNLVFYPLALCGCQRSLKFFFLQI